MKFRKLFVMSACVACGLTLASCGDTKDSNSGADTSSSGATTDKTSVNVGVGYKAVYNGTSQVDVTTAMVAFDNAGKVVDTRIDVVQVKFAANEAKDGLALANTNVKDGYVTTKLELGKDYNMVVNPNCVAEVDIQIEAFADWSKGKTPAEMRSFTEAKDHNGKDALYLKAGTLANCTIVVEDFIDAIESAWALKSATAVEVPSTFTTGIGMNATLKGKEVTVDVCGALVSGGKVVAASMDAVYLDFAVDATSGAVTLDTTSKYYDATKTAKSKKTLGDAYAMAKKNGGKETCTLEWYEQAAIIESGVVGKTSTEISALEKNKGDLAGATIELDVYLKAFAKAATYADMEHIGPQA